MGDHAHTLDAEGALRCSRPNRDKRRTEILRAGEVVPRRVEAGRIGDVDCLHGEAKGGPFVEMRLADRRTRLSNGLVVRELSDSGKQTAGVAASSNSWTCGSSSTASFPRRVMPNAVMRACFHFRFAASSKKAMSLGLDPGQPPSM